MKTTKTTRTGKPPKTRKSKVQRKEEQEREAQLIIEHVEARVVEPFTDKRLDREFEIIELLNGKKTTLHDIKKRYIAAKAQEWKLAFTQDFYKEVFRLNRWPIPDGDISEKPHVVAQWTNEVVYLRFTKDILDELRRKNPFRTDLWLREKKHHQWLTREGREKLLGFIDDAIDGMKACATWYEFYVKHAKRYDLPYQLKMNMGEA